MKKMKLLPVVAVLLLAGCSQSAQKPLEIANPFDEAVSGKAMIVSRAEMLALNGSANDELVVLVKDAEGNILPSQCDDLDGDGQWDELVFLADFDAREAKEFYFSEVKPSDAPQFPVRTNVRFGRQTEPYEEVSTDLRLKSVDSPTISAVYQMEGPTWENDLVGFRNYYDARNGIDIFGKRTTAMSLDKAGIAGQNYHELDDWGMDILKVGNSLGAGAIAIGINDSIYRVGPCDEAGYKLLAEGPVRSVIELWFKGVPAGDRKYDVVHRISICAGDHFYRSSVQVNGLQGDEVLFTGIVDLHELPAFEAEKSGFKIYATLGAQAYKGENLGLGLLIPENQFIQYKEAPKVGNGVTFTHLAAISLSADTASQYAFFSGWEYQDPKFADKEYFTEMMRKAAVKLALFN
ncbi:DUF4861 domain-containing protein [Geofilum sp. OHC36d9]|uniref:DUF4861 domain-containing protein n=1 Tax=Geofilum sp. OHC36d9 TaxID=3458413 RepID=UPI0040338C09